MTALEGACGFAPYAKRDRHALCVTHRQGQHTVLHAHLRHLRADIALAQIGHLETNRQIAAGDREEVTAPVEQMGLGAAAPTGDQSILGGGDPPDKA